MRLISVSPDELASTPQLSRSTSTKSFEDRLRSSIGEIGLVEPLKVAKAPEGGYVVIDGVMRLKAVRDIRQSDPNRFGTVPAYLLDYDARYEIRYQSDIYQDLLPSQLATLVEHLHTAETVLKVDIARYIGISPTTLRNYTGLWRLIERGGLFARIVELMDVDVLPSSNPYAWLRLTDQGLSGVLVDQFTDGRDPDEWITATVNSARLGSRRRYALKFVESATGALPPDAFRVGERERAIKRAFGRRKGGTPRAPGQSEQDFTPMLTHLRRVRRETSEPVLRLAAQAMCEYLT